MKGWMGEDDYKLERDGQGTLSHQQFCRILMRPREFELMSCVMSSNARHISTPTRYWASLWTVGLMIATLILQGLTEYEMDMK